MNRKQQEAAQFGSGPLLIIAGAGTGKTNTLAHRVAHLVLSGAQPERILLLTFTRRAALEMTRRTQRIVGSRFQVPVPGSVGSAFGTGNRNGNPGTTCAVRFPWSGTFHSIANRLIRRHAAAVGLDTSFSVLDRGDAADLMDVLRHELGFSKADKRFPRKDTCLAIYSHRVNTQRPLADTLDALFPWCAEWEPQLTQLYRAYVERKLANQALDYDDLLLYWHAMMSDQRLAAEIGGEFDHILVDEYQDTNVLQAEILKGLRQNGDGVTVVGDDAQAIYSFRAATVDNILGFPDQYVPENGLPASVITLEDNYRSTQGVLDAANALMAEGTRQYRKVLRTTKGAGHAAALRDGRRRPVAGRVCRGADSRDARERRAAQAAGGALSELASQRHARARADAPQHSLREVRRPEVSRGRARQGSAGGSALGRQPEESHRRVSRAAAAAGHGTVDGRAVRRAIRASRAFRGTRSGTSARPAALAEAWDPFAELMVGLAVTEGPWQGQVARTREWFEPHLERIYDSAHVRLGDLIQLERLAQQFATRDQFLAELALDPPAVTGDLSGTPYLDEDYLILSTVHSAKGQEWDAVYILNVADGNFPSEFSTGRSDQIEEERRLLYVAMTRAKNDLHLIAPLKYYVANQPKNGDRHVYGARSRFLTKAVMARLDAITWPENGDRPTRRAARARPASTWRESFAILWS